MIKLKPKKSLAVVQSNYIPWKGYFDLINSVDECVLLDDVQYTRRDWRNRNRIKTRTGPAWLTIPVNAKGRYLAPINEVTISDAAWGVKHWRTISANYARAPHFSDHRHAFERLYLDSEHTHLSAINHTWIRAICAHLGIRTKLSWSMDYHLVEGRTERLVDICRQAGATEYLSGPAAKGYIDDRLFEQAGIKLTYFDYAGYPEYPQLFPPFDHHVTVLDLMFNTGPDATAYMLSF